MKYFSIVYFLLPLPQTLVSSDRAQIGSDVEPAQWFF